jgi:hypothetical protein
MGANGSRPQPVTTDADRPALRLFRREPSRCGRASQVARGEYVPAPPPNLRGFVQTTDFGRWELVRFPPSLYTR